MFPNRTDKALLLVGLLSLIAGQITLIALGPVTKEDGPVDFGHWLMVLAMLLIIPFAARLPRRGLAIVAGPMLMIGSVMMVGMCVLDLVFWSFPDDALRGTVAEGLWNTPMVWQPFIVWSGPVFTVALGLVALDYWRVSKLAVALAVLGTIVVGVWGLGSNPYGYSMVLAGFAWVFWAENKGAAAPE